MWSFPPPWAILFKNNSLKETPLSNAKWTCRHRSWDGDEYCLVHRSDQVWLPFCRCACDSDYLPCTKRPHPLRQQVIIPPLLRHTSSKGIIWIERSLKRYCTSACMTLMYVFRIQWHHLAAESCDKKREGSSPKQKALYQTTLLTHPKSKI